MNMNEQVEYKMPSLKNLRILALNAGGEPLDWISFEDCLKQQEKGNISWQIGEQDIVLRGGFNSRTGQQSVCTFAPIIALKYGGTKVKRGEAYRPHLSNEALFNRDRHMCAYCGRVFATGKLTRDHVHPVSKGGKDIWENVVSACSRCNQKKADKFLDQLEMKLLYVPYAPSFHEHLILENRNILIDQMEFLLKGVGKHSKLHEEYKHMLEKQERITLQ
jgi:hypothetical protein